MRPLVRLAAALLVAVLGPVYGAQAYTCPVLERPIVSVEHGSRYTTGSTTHSDFDDAGEAEIEAVLGPIDKYIIDLANLSNRALRKQKEGKLSDARESADCLLDSVESWAKGRALTKIGSLNAQLSTPSRVGGIAMAYANVIGLGSNNPARKRNIDDWLAARATAIITFFDGPDVPPNAQRNNLRAWAALAVTRIGLIVGDKDMVYWGEASVRATICTSNTDGSLPYEMKRGPLSLHYQIHAVTPLVMTTVLISETRKTYLMQNCDGALSKVIAFTLKAIIKPDLVKKITGKTQSVKSNGTNLIPSEMAWLAPWLTLKPDDSAAKLRTKKFTLFSNSKLGGDLTIFWPLK